MEWQPISTAPKDGRKILAWCCHGANKYHNDDGTLTDYGANVEGMTHAEDGPQIVEWWPGDWDIDEFRDKVIKYPAWWVVSYTDNECFANPTHWIAISDPERKDNCPYCGRDLADPRSLGECNEECYGIRS